MESPPVPYLRRDFLLATASVIGATSVLKALGTVAPKPALPARLPTPQEILAVAGPARPLKGGLIPADLARRLGTAHVAGRYFFTDQPYLIEGAQRVQALGLGGIKLWFGNLERSYPFNSRWNLPGDITLEQIARHSYFAAAFALPFSVIALELMPTRLRAASGERRAITHHEADFRMEEDEVFALAAHLLRTYGERDLTFLLQNWEGDWMLRGGTGAKWTKDEHPDLERRVAAFTSWFSARQRGVERARAAVPGTRCRVFHAVEVNKVFEGEAGVPTLTTHVLPRIKPDFISWSAYDGLHTGAHDGDTTAIGVWRGLDFIQRHARTTQADHDGRPAVYVGEIGFPENVTTPTAAVEMIDGALGTLFARRIPYILHWELFCNERKDGKKHLTLGPDPADALRGFWLVRPDGSLSATGTYFRRLIAHAGARLPPVAN